MIKKLVTILSIVLCGIGSNFVSAQDKQIGTIIKKGGVDVTRPHSPSNQMISIEYDSANHLLMFSTNTNIKSISATFCNLSTGDVYSFDVDFSDPIVYQDLDGGEYEIVCISDDGQEFSGYFTIN